MDSTSSAGLVADSRAFWGGTGDAQDIGPVARTGMLGRQRRATTADRRADRRPARRGPWWTGANPGAPEPAPDRPHGVPGDEGRDVGGRAAFTQRQGAQGADPQWPGQR